MKKSIFLIFFFLVFIESNLSAKYYPWPLDYKKVIPMISSSFGEYRPQRLHTGLDFRTNGRINQYVKSLGDGYVYRVKISPYGYGKALYIKLYSGNIIVYGHLEKFYNKLEKYVYQKQLRKKRYDIDLVFKRDQFKVKKNQVIAYSGETGIGAPHLHLEVRNANNIPQNLVNYFNLSKYINDRKKPVINKIAFVPLSNESIVNDSLYDIALLDCTRKNLAKIWHLEGKFGIAVKTYDKVSRYIKSGVNKIKFYFDGKLYYQIYFPNIPFNYVKEGQLIYNYKLLGIGKYHNLYSRTKIHLLRNDENGIIDIKDNKVHLIKIVVYDIYNNVASVEVKVSSNKKMATDFPMDKLFFYKKKFYLTDNAIIEYLSDNKRNIKDNSYKHLIFIDDRISPKKLSNIKKYAGGIFRISYKNITIESDINPFYYEKTFVRIAKVPNYSHFSGVKYVKNSCFELSPYELPLKKQIFLKIKLNKKNSYNEKLGLYLLKKLRNGKEKIIFVSNDIDNGVLTAYLKEFTRYALFIDNVNPKIDWHLPKKHKTMWKKRYIFKVKLVDKGSGIDYRTIKILLNGHLIIGEFEPENNRLTFSAHGFLKKGKNQLLISAKDFSGNFSEKTFNFKI